MTLKGLYSLLPVPVQKYIRNNAYAQDRAINALAGGDPDMTVSGRLGKYYKGSIMERFVDLIFGRDHCEKEAAKEANEGSDAIIK